MLHWALPKAQMAAPRLGRPLDAISAPRLLALAVSRRLTGLLGRTASVLELCLARTQLADKGTRGSEDALRGGLEQLRGGYGAYSYYRTVVRARMGTVCLVRSSAGGTLDPFNLKSKWRGRTDQSAWQSEWPSIRAKVVSGQNSSPQCFFTACVHRDGGPKL